VQVVTNWPILCQLEQGDLGYWDMRLYLHNYSNQDLTNLGLEDPESLGARDDRIHTLCNSITPIR